MGSPARQARPSALARSVCEDVSENSSLPRGFQGSDAAVHAPDASPATPSARWRCGASRDGQSRVETESGWLEPKLFEPTEGPRRVRRGRAPVHAFSDVLRNATPSAIRHQKRPRGPVLELGLSGGRRWREQPRPRWVQYRTDARRECAASVLTASAREAAAHSKARGLKEGSSILPRGSHHQG